MFDISIHIDCTPFINDLHQQTEKNGFKLLAMVDVGWAYWFSSEPIFTPEDLRKNKIFSEFIEMPKKS